MRRRNIRLAGQLAAFAKLAPFAALASLTLVSLASQVALERPARADTSSWFAIGPGYAINRNFAAQTNDRADALTYSLGVGSTPIAPVVIGGIVRGTSYFSQGTDLGIALRGATGGFARGDWGVALDGGIIGRFWGGGAYGRLPLQAILTLGAPWGLQLGLGSTFTSASGAQGAFGIFGVVEIDLLRLTLMRQGSTERYWPNPMPAGGHFEPAASQPAPQPISPPFAQP